MSTSQIHMTAHVGRAILQAAAQFNTPHKAIWEYVVNSLQYVDRGNNPVIDVRVNKANGKIVIADNGRGMDREVLANFFMLSAENIDRMQDKAGRGKFGTGKIAAFGIGESLTVCTVKDGVKNELRLTKTEIYESDGSDLPVKDIISDQPHDGPNGTVITISGIVQPSRLNADRVKKHIEKLMRESGWEGVSPSVKVNSQLCKFVEIETRETHTFRPTVRQEKIIGDVILTLNVATEPQGKSCGVAVTSGLGNLVGRENCGIDRKPQGEYIFGHVDVPALESNEYDTEAFDSSRSLNLNREDPRVRSLVVFMAACMEKVRNLLVANLQQAEDDLLHQKLAKEANRITEILNEDFDYLKLEALNSVPRSSAPTGSAGNGYVSGSAEPGNIYSPNVAGGNDSLPREEEPTFADISSPGQSNPDGLDTVDPGLNRSNRRSSGFNVQYRNLGETHDRSLYEKSTLTIVINEDHPVLKAALISSSVDDPVFRRLSYEIAFSEYAFAVGYELLDRDSLYPGDDLLFDVRETLNRVSKSAANLYRS